LVGEQGGAGLPDGVVGQDEGVAGVVGEQDLRRGEGLPGPRKARGAVGGGAGDLLQRPGAGQLVDLGGADLPSTHYGTVPVDAVGAAP
jgi:hypothetical protein